MQELARTEKLLVCYNSSDETLLIRWEGSISSEELRSGYGLIMEQVRRYRPVKWLLDLQKRSTIRREVEDKVAMLVLSDAPSKKRIFVTAEDDEVLVSIS